MEYTLHCRRVTPTGPPLDTKENLLKSCRIHLDLLLRSYLEEVAAEFFDIEHHASRIETFQRLKQVEDVLAASVKPKLEAILNTKKQSHLFRLAQQIWASFSLSVVSAALGRVFALRLVNELYRCLGVWDRVQDYEDQWLQVSASLRDLFGGSFDALFQAGSDPDLLRRAREEFAGDDIDGLDRLAMEAHGRLWLQRFIEFARFVWIIRRERPSVGTPRLFISAQHRIAPSTAFVQTVGTVLQGRVLRDGRPLAEISQVGRGTGGDEHHIERLVKSRIWNSDVVLGVIPKDWTNAHDGGVKNLEWVAREADHALLLNRRLHLFVKNGTDRAQVHGEFQKRFPLLSPAEGRLSEEERRRLLPERFREFSTDEFQYDGDAPDVKRLEEVVDSARRRHAQDLVRGWLRQFSRTDRYVILKVQQVARYKTTKTEILSRLLQAGINDRFFGDHDEARHAFERAWENSRKRFLRINEYKVSLIAREGHSYRGTLRGILERLRPELTPQQTSRWHDSLVNQILEGL